MAFIGIDRNASTTHQDAGDAIFLELTYNGGRELLAAQASRDFHAYTALFFLRGLMRFIKYLSCSSKGIFDSALFKSAFNSILVS